MDQPQPLATIAERVGITVRTLRKHAERDGFPAPAVRCGKCGSARERPARRNRAQAGLQPPWSAALLQPSATRSCSPCLSPPLVLLTAFIKIIAYFV